jgi:hypothetical protein
MLLILLSTVGTTLISSTALAVGPRLSFSPTTLDFGEIQKGESDLRIFSIWNSGGCSCGTLTYNFVENIDWITINPSSGASTGEHDIIDVIIDTSNLNIGEYSNEIMIQSNAGTGTINIIVNVIEGQINKNPYSPQISGPNSGNIGVDYSFMFQVTDPDSDDMTLTVEWGDGDIEEEDCSSGERIKLQHLWENEQTYSIRAKLTDIHGAESEWSEYEISMPKNKLIEHPILSWFFEILIYRFPIFEKILNQII